MNHTVRNVARPVCAAAMISMLVTTLVYAADDPAQTSSLEQEVARLQEDSHTSIGLAAIHAESGRSVYLNPDVTFPMASTKKVAIAVKLLTLVDQKRMSLSTPVLIKESDLYRHGLQPLGNYVREGSSLTLHDLLALMLIVSDNNATDILLHQVGGTAAVNARLQELGIQGLSVDNPTNVVIAHLLGRDDATEAHPLTPQEFAKLADSDVPQSVQDAEAEAYEKSGRDASTPRAMATLLSKIWRREALSPASTDVLLGILYRCELGKARLKALLPPKTPIAHKTGTAGGSTNDVGIITLPGNAGHVIVAAFTSGKLTPGTDTREATLAQIGRAVYDYFLYSR